MFANLTILAQIAKAGALKICTQHSYILEMVIPSQKLGGEKKRPPFVKILKISCSTITSVRKK